MPAGVSSQPPCPVSIQPRRSCMLISAHFPPFSHRSSHMRFHRLLSDGATRTHLDSDGPALSPNMVCVCTNGPKFGQSIMAK